MKWHKQWYNEYHNGIRIHDYFAFIVNQFPIFVVRKIDDPHSQDNFGVISIGLFGFTWYIYKREI